MTFSVDFLSKSWLCSTDDLDKSDMVLVGIPYDGTCSFKPGTRFGPEAARVASIGLESYSPYQDKDLEDSAFYDAGELDLPFGNRDKVLDIIYTCAKETLSMDKKFVGVGGEHLVTYPVLKAYLEKYPDIAVIHFDAHADLREDYLDESLSHATVMRRITDHIGADSFKQVGIRSGTKEEFAWIRKNNTLLTSLDEAKEVVQKFKNRPIFLSIDLDVLDPSIMSGTGTQEAGGLNFKEFIEWLKAFSSLNFVGADIVELSPAYDTSGVSTVTAAKVIREVLLMMS
ncbi:MAG: agmatinase [bacterium]